MGLTDAEHQEARKMTNRFWRGVKYAFLFVIPLWLLFSCCIYLFLKELR